jgi:hypothetical protein
MKDLALLKILIRALIGLLAVAICLFTPHPMLTDTALWYFAGVYLAGMYGGLFLSRWL